MRHTPHTLALPGGGTLPLGPDPLVMGILNLTPDSFSDGGDFAAPHAALAQARLQAEQGAHLLDIGGESTRPGAEEIGVQAELDRVMPVLDALAAAHHPLPISIDTYKALVAHQALQAGAQIVNDVHGLQREPEIAGVAADAGAPVIVMHWDPERDRDKDLIGEMLRYFAVSLAVAERQGLAREQIVLDPGFGFAKTLSENYSLLNRLQELAVLGLPLLIGTSRKSMIGRLVDRAPKDRLAGTLASAVLAYHKGGHVFRVHDVAEHVDALRVARAACHGVPEDSS